MRYDSLQTQHSQTSQGLYSCYLSEVRLHKPQITSAVTERRQAMLMSDQEGSSVPTPQPAGKLILVVDYDQEHVKLVEDTLKPYGYRVVTAYDGVEALEKVKSEKPNMIILEVNLPRSSGWELMDRLQNDPETVNLPLIALTSPLFDDVFFRLWRAGATPLEKSFNPAELVTIVQRIFQLCGEKLFEKDEMWEV